MKNCPIHIIRGDTNNNYYYNKHAYAFNNTSSWARVDSERTKVVAEALHTPLQPMEAVFLYLILKKTINNTT
jgi:hypothetical protein